MMKSKKKISPFKFKPFSKRQLQVLTWWREGSPHQDKDAVICDGSVRAGKTVVMSLSYVMWAMETFSEENLGMSGKTIGALRRNVLTPLKRMLKTRGYKVKDHRADNYLTITYKNVSNDFYIFGGKDESSQDLIQGITLAGMFFDEVALMPKSFVDQATARCSVEGAKLWFNCNPAGPYHWFKLEWLDNLEKKNALHLHFTMDDNLSLSDKVKQRYYRMYTGVFFKRFILGLWVMAEGIIYDMFDDSVHIVDEVPKPEECNRLIACVDYGTHNPCVFLLLGRKGTTWYVIKEYYHDSKKVGRQKTDAQYSADMQEFLGEWKSRIPIYIDPSAASFIEQLRQDGIGTIDADNSVLDGIRTVGKLLGDNLLYVSRSCANLIREFVSYVWDEKAQQRGEDKPVKENDHALDALRYGLRTELGGAKPMIW
jgi:PBSX family phage terminase large subunit